MGAITGVDGWQQEELDEERALYGCLHEKNWSEIPTSFIEQNPDGVVLLTDEAFTVFLPAWLTCAIERDNVREMMVYTFSGDLKKSSDRIDRRMRQLAPIQRDAIRAFLVLCVDVESSKFVRQHAQSALDYMNTFD
jgi:hypothetical protein